MSGTVYPATTSAEAVALTISNANQLHQIVNGDTETTVETFEGLGNIPSVAKALKDAAVYKSPLAWSEGATETELLQPRLYLGNLYVPLTAPALMGASPDSTFWRLYAPLSRVVIQKEKQLGSAIVANVSTLTTISYAVGENNLQVFVDGALAEEGADYNETTSTTVTWLIDIPADADILFFSGNTTSGEFDASYLLSIVASAEAAQAAAEVARDGAIEASAVTPLAQKVTAQKLRTWVASAATTNTSYAGVAYAHSLGMVLMMRQSGGVSYSLNRGRTFTGLADAALVNVSSFDWSPTLSLFVAVGTSGALYTSPDGITWTVQTAPVSWSMYYIKWVPEISKFVASGTTEGWYAAESSDGVTWTSIASVTIGAFKFEWDATADYMWFTLFGTGTYVMRIRLSDFTSIGVSAVYPSGPAAWHKPVYHKARGRLWLGSLYSDDYGDSWVEDTSIMTGSRDGVYIPEYEVSVMTSLAGSDPAIAYSFDGGESVEYAQTSDTDLMAWITWAPEIATLFAVENGTTNICRRTA